MRRRIAALLAVLSLGLVPAFAGAVDAPPAEGGTPVVLVKAYATVAEVSPTAIALDVSEGYEWLDGTENKVAATGIHGTRITAAVTATSIVRLGDKPKGMDVLKPGMKIKALMRTDGQPVTPQCTFTLLEAYVEVPKVHPADKFEWRFFHRLWHVRGTILNAETIEGRNVLNLDVRRLEHAPKRFRDEGSRLVSMDAYVIVPPRVVITDVDGSRMPFSALDVDFRVKVVTKMLPKSRWMNDESGDPTPTLTAKRIKVIRR